MADEQDKKPSADEIVDNMAEEMGVKDEKVPESDESDSKGVSGLEGIFDVAPKKKKKKKDEPAEEKSEAKAEESSDDSAGESSSEDAPKKKKKKASIDGVFDTSGDGGSDVDFGIGDDGFLGEDDLGDYEPKGQRGTTTMLVGIIVILIVALVAVVGSFTDVGKDVMLVFKGEYRAQKLAEKKAKEDAFKAEQLAKLPKYGSLLITGSPRYANIKLNGEVQYAQIGGKDNVWRDIQLEPGTSNFLNLSIKENKTVEVYSPGFDTLRKEITEQEWQGNKETGTSFTYNLQATLTPASPEAKYEFDARMGEHGENEYFGKVTIKSMPEGASIVFNNVPLMNEKGEELKTPVTFEKYYVKDDKGKLEERQVKVNTIPDQGHKIEIRPPQGSGLPNYLTQLNRQMWECQRKSEDEIKKLGEDHPLPAECNYAFTKTMDFNGLKAYIDRREAERKRIEAENKKIREIMSKGGATDGAKISADEK